MCQLLRQMLQNVLTVNASSHSLGKHWNSQTIITFCNRCQTPNENFLKIIEDLFQICCIRSKLDSKGQSIRPLYLQSCAGMQSFSSFVRRLTVNLNLGSSARIQWNRCKAKLFTWDATVCRTRSLLVDCAVGEAPWRQHVRHRTHPCFNQCCFAPDFPF